MLGNAVYRAYLILPDTVHMPVRGSLSRTPLRTQGPKFVFALRPFQEGPSATGVFRWAWPRTYTGLVISMPYISPPLIRTRFPGGIKELVEPFDLGDLVALARGYGLSLMFISKDAPSRGIRYSCHYCLAVREPKRRADWLRLAFARPFVSSAHLLLD